MNYTHYLHLLSVETNLTAANSFLTRPEVKRSLTMTESNKPQIKKKNPHIKGKVLRPQQLCCKVT